MPLPAILQNWNDDFYKDKRETYFNGLEAWVAQGWNDEKRADVAHRIKWSLRWKEKSIDLSKYNVRGPLPALPPHVTEVNFEGNPYMYPPKMVEEERIKTEPRKNISRELDLHTHQAKEEAQIKKENLLRPNQLYKTGNTYIPDVLYLNKMLGTDMVKEIRTGISSSGLFTIIVRDGQDVDNLRAKLEKTPLASKFDFSRVFKSSYISHSIDVKEKNLIAQDNISGVPYLNKILGTDMVKGIRTGIPDELFNTIIRDVQDVDGLRAALDETLLALKRKFNPNFIAQENIPDVPYLNKILGTDMVKEIRTGILDELFIIIVRDGQDVDNLRAKLEKTPLASKFDFRVFKSNYIEHSIDVIEKK